MAYLLWQLALLWVPQPKPSNCCLKIMINNFYALALAVQSSRLVAYVQNYITPNPLPNNNNNIWYNNTAAQVYATTVVFIRPPRLDIASPCGCLSPLHPIWRWSRIRPITVMRQKWARLDQCLLISEAKGAGVMGWLRDDTVATTTGIGETMDVPCWQRYLYTVSAFRCFMGSSSVNIAFHLSGVIIFISATESTPRYQYWSMKEGPAPVVVSFTAPPNECAKIKS